MRLSCLYEGGHRLEDFVNFSSFTVDEIFRVKFEKIVIFKTLVSGPVTLPIVGIVGGVFSNSFFFILFLFFFDRKE